MSVKRKAKKWILSLDEGDLIGIRWPDWPCRTSTISKRIGIFLSSHERTSVAIVIDPLEGEVVCLHEQLFPIVKFVARDGECANDEHI
jgi:hypothetical protein